MRLTCLIGRMDPISTPVRLAAHGVNRNVEATKIILDPAKICGVFHQTYSRFSQVSKFQANTWILHFPVVTPKICFYNVENG
jgi:hypothetical protein